MKKYMVCANFYNCQHTIATFSRRTIAEKFLHDNVNELYQLYTRRPDSYVILECDECEAVRTFENVKELITMYDDYYCRTNPPGEFHPETDFTKTQSTEPFIERSNNRTDYIIDTNLMSEYKDKIYKEVRRLHEAINDFYSYTEPHTKIESDLFLSMEDIYKDIVDVIRKGDQKIVDTILYNK